MTLPKNTFVVKSTEYYKRILKSPSPSKAVRVLLFAEVLVFAGVVMGCIWLAPAKGQSFSWYHIVLWTVAVILPVGANILHGDRPADSGLRIDNITASARQVIPVTIIMALGITVVGLTAGGFHADSWVKLSRRGGEYLAGGIIQQYLLQAFMLRRLRQGGLPKAVAVFFAVLLFALVHSPNWVLMGLTTASGIVWCSLFLSRANILTLGVSHGLLALLVYHALPKAWHLGLAIGPKFIARAAQIYQ